MKTFDICLVGGGMVGATLALLLAQQRQDWRIGLVESFPMAAAKADNGAAANTSLYQPSFDARSSALSLGTVQVFQDLGLWQELSQHHTAIKTVHVSDRGHFGGSKIHHSEEGVELLGSVVENAWLGQVLFRQLQQQNSIEIIAPAKVNQLKPKARGMSFNISQNSEEVHCFTQLMVLADGGESPLAQSLGIDYQVSDYQQGAIIANVEFSQAHQHVAYERFTGAGPMALLPLGEAENSRRSALVWTQPKDKTDALMALPEQEFLQQLQQQFGFRQGEFIKLSQRFSYPLQLKVAQEQIRSGLVLMGNAAHFLHPVAGQGFNLALRDCTALCEVLDQAQQAGQALGELSVLQKYLHSQQVDQELTVGFSDSIVRMFSNNRTMFEVARNLGFLGLDLIPQAKQYLAKQTMGLANRKHRLNKGQA